MTAMTREEFAARRKEAERRAIIIGQKQRKGEYKLPQTKPAPQRRKTLLERIGEGMDSIIRPGRE